MTLNRHDPDPAAAGTPRPPEGLPEAARAQISALMDSDSVDGHLSRQVLDGCQAWQADHRWREQWHVYHLIGDALRSEELADVCGREGAFMRGLRERLAAEPVVLAPMPVAAVPAAAAVAALPVAAAGGSRWRGRQRWQAPAALAAGFVAVAGVVLVLRQPAADPAQMASVRGSPAAVVAAGAVVNPAPAGAAAVGQAVGQTPGAVLASGPGEPMQPATASLIREARLDRYVATHRSAFGSGFAPAALPGAGVRHVSNVSVDDK